jgi:hypothetical protein
MEVPLILLYSRAYGKTFAQKQDEKGKATPSMSPGSRIAGDMLHFAEINMYRFDKNVRLDGYTFLREGEN